jgi:hypothetical protein
VRLMYRANRLAQLLPIVTRVDRRRTTRDLPA